VRARLEPLGRIMAVRAVQGAALLAFALLSAAPVLADARPSDSFTAIERQVIALQGRMVKSTVNIRVSGSSGSGVIISADGYVLTAGHVTGKANRKCRVTLSDGKNYDAMALGLDPETDFALVKIDGATALPASPIGDSSTLRPGQWVVATGHPLGLHPGRPPVVRIGRVLGYPEREKNRTASKVITDAPLISGDSGGPLFDLNGRVVGINVMIGGGRKDGISMHTLINLPKYVLENLKKGETLTEPPTAPQDYTQLLGQAKAQLARGENAAAIATLGQCQAKDPTDASVRLLTAHAQARARNYPAAISSVEQACSLGYSDVELLRGDRDFSAFADNPRFKQLVERLTLWAGLPGDRKRDRQFLTAAGHLCPEMGRGVVRILADGLEVAYGTVMSAGGEVLTKASELPEGELRCILADGRVVPVARKTRDPKWDVALLQVQATGLETVELTETYGVGQWVFTPEPSGSVVAAGVIGVAEMPVSGRGIARRPSNGGFMGVRMEELEPEVLQKMGLKGGVRVTADPDFPAAKAGVQSGDVLYQVDAEQVTDPESLSDYLGGKKPGEQVTVRVVRGAEKLQFTVVLGVRPERLASVPSLAETLSGDISQMQGPFPTVLHHDTVLRPSAMGGPVVNENGKCIGMNIARADRTSTYALPARVVREIYQRLRG
jgi:serine protease Do